MEQDIREYFEDKKDVVAVYLFGSQATGKAGNQSDVDIGIVADGKNPEPMIEKRLIFISELSRILRKDVHPVILNFASKQLIRQIFEKGKCILVNDKKRLARFKMFEFAELADFAYYKELTQSGFLRKVMEA
jgi:predicted nucleotidyltransferase